MNITDYKFNVGDEIITTEGVRGKIVYICKCSQCVERGFCEPTWIAENDNNEEYITISDVVSGFHGFYQIGNYRFHDFDKSGIIHNMAYYEKKLKQLKKQLKLIEKIERRKY